MAFNDFISLFAETICGKYEKKLLRHLMADYDDMERPVEDESDPLQLVFGVTLQQIIDVVILLTDILIIVLGANEIVKYNMIIKLF